MASSTLDPDNLPLGSDRRLYRGHGTGALGPSDTSDSGSDLQGAPGLAQQDEFPLDTGTTSDLEESSAHNTAGPDVGDANLDSDTDSSGTGERATAGRDTVVPDGADIGIDQIRTTINVDDEEFDTSHEDEQTRNRSQQDAGKRR
jgi:hypothetical protein